MCGCSCPYHRHSTQHKYECLFHKQILMLMRGSNPRPLPSQPALKFAQLFLSNTFLFSNTLCPADQIGYLKSDCIISIVMMEQAIIMLHRKVYCVANSSTQQQLICECCLLMSLATRRFCAQSRASAILSGVGFLRHSCRLARHLSN